MSAPATQQTPTPQTQTSQSQAPPPQKPKQQVSDQPEKHRIRITLTSRNVKSLEKGFFFHFPCFLFCIKNSNYFLF